MSGAVHSCIDLCPQWLLNFTLPWTRSIGLGTLLHAFTCPSPCSYLLSWLAMAFAAVYVPVQALFAVFYSSLCKCDVGAAALLISAWVRYAGTVKTLPVRGSYTLLIFGQVSIFRDPLRLPDRPKIFASITQPIFQVLGPKYSETWFDLKGRTTATMLISIGKSLSPVCQISPCANFLFS